MKIWFIPTWEVIVIYLQIRAWNNSAEQVGQQLKELHANSVRPAIVLRHLMAMNFICVILSQSPAPITSNGLVTITSHVGITRRA